MAANRRAEKASNSNEQQKNDKLKQVMEQLDQAEQEMNRAAAGTRLLHQQWRKLLSRLSYILVLLCLHQVQGPVNTCLKDIRSDGEEESLANTLVQVLVDSAPAIGSMVLAAVLSFFLTQTPAGTFKSPRFVLATILALVISGIHAYQWHTKTLNVGCAGKFREEPRSFPVVVIFYGIVFICHAFMQWQASIAQRNQQTIRDVRSKHLQAAANQKSLRK